MKKKSIERSRENYPFACLRMELVMDWTDSRQRAEAERVLRQYGGVRYGGTITRDVIVPSDIPLYALHYVIQQAFGWQNSHLRRFELPEERYKLLTGNTAENWSELVGILFRSPFMDEGEAFWADDYKRGNFKTWLRKKYTGPYLSRCQGESFWQCRSDMNEIIYATREIKCEWSIDAYTNKEYMSDAFVPRDRNREESGDVDQEASRVEVFDFYDAPVRALDFIFEDSPRALLERLPLNQVLAIRDYETGQSKSAGNAKFGTFNDLMDAARSDILKLEEAGDDLPDRQPKSIPVTDVLEYFYDFGDDWHVRITGSRYPGNLIRSGRLTGEELEEARLRVWETYRPVCVAMDGCQLVDDMGGASGLLGFLRAINDDTGGGDNGPYEDRENSIEWASGLGWSARKASPARLL